MTLELKQEVEKARQLLKMCKELDIEWYAGVKTIVALADECERLQAALEHYANKGIWGKAAHHTKFLQFYGVYKRNGYDVAKEALAESEIK